MFARRLLAVLLFVACWILTATPISARQAANADQYAVAFEGAKMTAKYDFPLDPSAEVIMTATFEGSAAKGTWSLRPKDKPDELASGGIAVTKK